MHAGSGFPCRVYAPAQGWFATAHSRDSVGVAITRDGSDVVEYCPATALVEVIVEELGAAQLIDGRVLMHGTLTLEGEDHA